MNFKNVFNKLFNKSNENEFVFTIIIAVYNTEKYLNEAIDSILSQSFDFKKIQIILVDDGSTDNSAKICKDYVKRYPKNFVYIYQDNQGHSVARNNGLKYAQGTYINFLDSDDKLQSNTLTEVYEHFISWEGELDVISLPRRLFGRINGDMALNYKYSPSRIVDIKKEYDFPVVAINASFIKRSALAGNFNPNLIISEDSLLINKTILKKCKFGVLGDVYYLYRKREDENSIIDTKKSRKEYFCLRMKEYFKALINESIEKHGCVLKYIQTVLMYDLHWLFTQNTEKDVLNDEEKKQYYSHIFDVLQYVEDDIILQQDFSNFLKYKFLNFKHDCNDFEITGEEGIILNYDGKVFDKLKDYPLVVTDISINEEILELRAYFEFYPSDFTIDAFNNDSLIDLNCYDIKENYSLDTVLSKRQYYSLEATLMRDENKIYFKINFNSKSYILNINIENIDINNFEEYNFKQNDCSLSIS